MIFKNPVIPKDFEITTPVQDSLIKKILHTLFWACPLGRILAGINYCNCLKTHCSYSKFIQKLKSIKLFVKLRLSTCRFSSVESMASLGLRLKWDATTVILAINQVAESSMEFIAFHKRKLPAPSRRNIPRANSFLRSLKRKEPVLIIILKT